ncbi:MAG: hypothetical protein ACI88H_002460 [Cocleimonas sp.]|jgi:hypothetical protein
MKFYIKKIILWLNNGKMRELAFEPNKVNVITGDSSTGKSEILDIIDYCFFASESKISESIVNENIAWYGVQFYINNKNYTVARKSLTEGKVNSEYYFSSEGDVPDEVFFNNTEGLIKSLLETEFNIDSNVAIPYGSNLIKPGSKISLRFFFMFNTISVNIIENDSGVFFDKQNLPRYRDALPRIFDLAVGIETIENVLKKEKKAELEYQLARLKKKNISISDKSSSFKAEQEFLIKEAKEYSLIDSNLNVKDSLEELKNIISGIESNQTIHHNEDDQVEHEIYLRERKVSNLKRFSTEYNTYKKYQKETCDSLKPIEYLRAKDADIIKTSIFDEVMNSFASELKQIRDTSRAKTPIDKQVNDEVKTLEKELIDLKARKAIKPEVNKSFNNDKSKYFFLGEIKSKMDLYSTSNNSLMEVTSDIIENLETKISAIKVDDTLQKRELTIKVIEEIISEFIESTDTALVNYASYQPVFNYKDKALLLKKPKATYIENVGSSSNHMFLHLFFTLAMQEIAFKNNSPFVAPYLVIDQPSRPYWGSGEKQKDKLDKSDIFKISKAFELLNSFITTRNNNSGDFQMIVFEHVPSNVFEGFENFHLVEEFIDGNALIPDDMLNGE